MDIVSTSKYNRISPKKVRLLSSQLHGRGVSQALEALKFVNQKAAAMLVKAVKAASADATHNFKMNAATLIVKTIEVNGGPSLKRFTARSRGMAHPILKRSSHIRVVLTEKPVEEVKIKKQKAKIKITEQRPKLSNREKEETT